MHELSIAISLVDLAEEELQKHPAAQVTAVHIKLGRLSGVVKAALESSYDLACAGTALAGSRLMIEEVPIVAFCPTCNAERAISSDEWFLCPECRSPISEVLHGKELELVALEIE